MNVEVWSEKVVIPTYEIGQPEKNPMFLEKRVYQGSCGKVYPYPVVEKISDERIDKEWLACFIENDFLKIMILPELGGRVQMAYDKTKERHFVYYNEVIKPALVGLTGPWISGGIEFNWPQHHRPSTYNPIDYYIENNENGSKTVWCSEIERMSGTKGMAGFTLSPDKAYLEIKVKLYNRTDRPQTFLWWANPAVAVNDDYMSVFPPDVNAVFDHGKRDVSSFPIATGTYYKFNYSPGTDISRYKNIPVPTSYMAIKSKYDFVGGYENDTQAGLLHVANHHISPGKKQWTWGNGDFGRAWDRNLTDNNGPYIELMCGVYTDNQPDFSWLMPYEEKTFTQYFMPYQDVGMVKNASKDAILNLEFIGNKALLKVYANGLYPNTEVKLSIKEEVIHEDTYDFRPGNSYIKEICIDKNIDISLYYIVVTSEDGTILIDWNPVPESIKTVPKPAIPASDPKEIETNEELYLNGLHLEQYRHATYNPLDYYQEALRRDPSDIRANNAMGLWFLRKAKFAKSENFFLKGYQRQIVRNPNPYEGELLFNMGLAMRYQEKHNEAYETFYKSVWNAAYMDSGYFQIAQIDALNHKWAAALDAVDRSLIRNWHNHKSRHLKVAILRKMGSFEKAGALIEESLALDNFNFALYYEKYLMNEPMAKNQLVEIMHGNIHNYIEVALDYAWAGMYKEAIAIIDLGCSVQTEIYPMALYFKAWFQSKLGDGPQALHTINKAEKCSPDYCFPNRLEAVLALEYAVQQNPKGARAPYYLGNFWYDAKQYADAITSWELSVMNQGTFPTAYRNLALAYYNKTVHAPKALKALETAFKLDMTDARIFMELDQLYKKLNKSVPFRLDLYVKHSHLVQARDDLYIEFANLHILENDFTTAYHSIKKRKFHPWEGGEGKASSVYKASLIGLANQCIEVKDFDKAINWLEKAKIYPDNLGEGKLPGTHENEINYWLGCALEGLGNDEEACKFWLLASSGDSEPKAAWFYNDQPPESIFYQGLAFLKLNNVVEAHARFNKLISYGNEHIGDAIKIDYFAVSLPDVMIWEEDFDKKNKNHCQYLLALGHKGKGDIGISTGYFKKVLKEDCSHMGVAIHQNVSVPSIINKATSLKKN